MSERANTEFKIFQKSLKPFKNRVIRDSMFQPGYGILNPSRYLCHLRRQNFIRLHSKGTLFKNDAF